MDDRAAIAAIRREPDERKRSALIGAFIVSKETLVRILVEKYARAEKTQADAEDLMQGGRDGMRRAIEDWDPERGALSTHAGWWIRNRVQAVARSAQPIALPRIRLTTAERSRVIVALKKNPDATADELGVKPGALEQVKKSFGLRFTSVDLLGDPDEMAARSRRIERRMTEAAEPEPDAEDELDGRHIARRLLSLAQESLVTLRVTAEDLVAELARALGCELPAAAAPTPKPPKVKRCPTPPSSPSMQTAFLPPWSRRLPRLLPTPPRSRTLAGEAGRRESRRPRASLRAVRPSRAALEPSARRQSLRLPLSPSPRPQAAPPSAIGSRACSGSPRTFAICRKKTAITSAPCSVARLSSAA